MVSMLWQLLLSVVALRAIWWLMAGVIPKAPIGWAWLVCGLVGACCLLFNVEVLLLARALNSEMRARVRARRQAFTPYFCPRCHGGQLSQECDHGELYIASEGTRECQECAPEQTEEGEGPCPE